MEHSARRDVVNILTHERFKFNWDNPTGHYRLEMEKKVSERNRARSVSGRIAVVVWVWSRSSLTGTIRNGTERYGQNVQPAQHAGLLGVHLYRRAFVTSVALLRSRPHCQQDERVGTVQSHAGRSVDF